MTKSDSRSDYLRITEIFLSLQGETRSTGYPTVFIRLTGCPLRCKWCDTAYAFSGGSKQSITQIINTVKKLNVSHVTVTGGEPMAQKGCVALLNQLLECNYEVSLETSGSIDLACVDKRVIKVMDIKAPGSGESDKNLWSNTQYLSCDDQIKFVLADREDYEWSKKVIDSKQLPALCEIIFSPVYETLDPRTLADWIVEDRLPVRFQIQLHKLLWGDEAGR